MKRRLLIMVPALAGVALLATAGIADALRVAAPPPGGMRAAQADVVVVGKVTEIEANEIQMESAPGAGNKIAFKVAVITVSEAIKGAAGQKTVRVAFIAPPKANPNPNPKNPKITPIRPPISSIQRGNQIEMGTEGMFFLTQSAKEGVYQAPNFFDIVASNAPTFAKDVTEAKDVLKILANPAAALKDSSLEKRTQAATLLVSAYRTPRAAGRTKEEAIDAEESKLILSALALGNWETNGRFDNNHPMNAFNNLGLTEKDGWRPPQLIQNQQELFTAMQNWLANNAATYRIKRIVPAK